MTGGPSAIPRWRSLSPLTLFAGGPWEVLLPAIVAAAFVAVAWILAPAMRIAAVTDWRLAAAAGAALAGMIAVRLFARIWSDARGAWPFVFASMVAGAVVLAVASQSLFSPTLTRASECAPPVVIGEPAAGRIASYALPVVMWIAWSLWLLTRFPHIENVAQLMHGRESRYRPYARALRVLLPVRLLLSALVVGGAAIWVFLLEPRNRPVSRPEEILATLAQPAPALADHARGGVLLARLRTMRAAEQQKALAHLAALEFDEARRAVRRCACDWLLPGDTLDPRIAAAEPAFQVLDREIDHLKYAWEPSATTGAAVLRLLPLGSAYDTRPPLHPLLWPATSPAAIPGAQPIAGDESPVRYRGETVMLVRRSTIATVAGNVLAEVAVKILGRSGRDQTLPELVSERVQTPPAEGPCPVAGSSYCATWSMGRWKLRLAPDENDAVTADVPLWLSLYDPAYVSRTCCVTDPAASR